MSRRHYDLPPLTALLTFETAARHMSFKQAAQDLSVTPGAVSHQIKALEKELGTALFLRKHRGVALTDQGAALYATLSTSFGQISGQLAKIKRKRDEQSVTVASTTAVATLWLSPDIIGFWRKHPDVNVNQITQDRPILDSHHIDLAIFYGKGSADAFEHTEIYRDRLVPVASPDMAARLQECSLPTLAEQRLIHLQAPSQRWTSWPEWFRALGHEGEVSDGVLVTNYSVALQFAQEGAGVALGWERLIAPLLDSGALCRVATHSLLAPQPFYLAQPTGRDLSPTARKLRDWILARHAET